MNMTQGIITIATGRREYIEMAIALGISISLHSPGAATAVISDSHSKLLSRVFDSVIQPPSRKSSGFLLKTSLHELSPFDRTLFVDADCLVVSDIREIFARLCGEPFVVIGDKIDSGYWFTDIPKLLSKIGCSALPKFNSGLIYFEKGKTSEGIFTGAQEVFARQDYYEIEAFKGGCPDEPCFAISMARQGVDAYPPPDKHFSFTPIGLVGKFFVDSIRGDAHWYLRDIGEVKPIVVHFVSRTNSPEYKSECVRLRLYYAGGWKKALMPLAASIVYCGYFIRRKMGAFFHAWVLRDNYASKRSGRT
jgi:hypothetical protein